jgi:hypothetical protein
MEGTGRDFRKKRLRRVMVRDPAVAGTHNEHKAEGAGKKRSLDGKLRERDSNNQLFLKFS